MSRRIVNIVYSFFVQRVGVSLSLSKRRIELPGDELRQKEGGMNVVFEAH